MGDSVIFFLTVLSANLFIIHGKKISEVLLAGSEHLTREAYHSPQVYLAFVILSFSIAYIRSGTRSTESKIAWTICLTFTAVVVTLIAPSSLIIFLMLYFWGIVSFIILIEPMIKLRKMDKEYWKIMLETVMKGVRYIFVGFTVLIVALEFLVPILKETGIGALSTLFYPVCILIYTLVMIGHWVLLPLWKRLTEAYAIEPTPRRYRGTFGGGT